MTSYLNISKLYLYKRLFEQVENAVCRAINFYNEESFRLELKWKDREYRTGVMTGIDDCGNGVTIEWEDYAMGCKVDGGTYTIPWEALSDDTYKTFITSLVNKQIGLVKANEELQKQRTSLYKMSQLERLQSEVEKLKEELREK